MVRLPVAATVASPLVEIPVVLPAVPMISADPLTRLT
jgi:ABC-type uncharacterized transport system substrate-binding protein